MSLIRLIVPPVNPQSPILSGYKRTIIIGDIHGCYLELMELLDSLQVTVNDDLICVGDLISKGPESRLVMQWAMTTPNLRCILGNHEARLLDQWLQGQTPEIASPNYKTYSQIGDLFETSMKFIRSWPLGIEREDFLVVHAGIDPRFPLNQQSRQNFLTMRIPSGMSIPWYEAYNGERLVVFGHWSRRDPVIRSNAIGLDTGCVYGGSLSALILPARCMVSVPAKSRYVENTSF